jgi:hypothetical protein
MSKQSQDREGERMFSLLIPVSLHKKLQAKSEQLNTRKKQVVIKAMEEYFAKTK